MSRIAATRSVPIVRQDLIIDVSQVREPAQWPDWIIDVSQVREPAQWPERCIYRVPKKLRNVNKDAYTPKLISIGPLHPGSEELKDMERLKVRYFKLYCDRVLKGEEGGASTADQEKEVQLQKRLASIVAENSEQIRHCYAECPPLGDEELVRMILVDATFIIELFLRAFGDAEDPRNDYILSKPWLRHDIEQDLILLENQLPFFILEKIHEEFSKHVKKEKTDFLTLASYNLISAFLNDKERSDLLHLQVKHLTDLLRYLICPPKAALEGEGSVDHPNSASKHVKKEKTNFLTLVGCFLTTPSSDEEEKSGLKGVKHLTDLLRYLFILPIKRNVAGEGGDHPNNTSTNPDKAGLNEGSPSNLPNRASKKPDEAGGNADQSNFFLPSASNLDGAGVEFKQGKDGLLDIEFKKGKRLEWIPCLNCSWLLACLPCCQCFPCSISMQPFKQPVLELPRFVVDDSTETVFRNLMALEQCHYDTCEAHICNYMLLLDCLIDTEKDVDLLVSKEIIDNQLGSNDEVKTMINKLGKEIGVIPYYHLLSEKLRKHCDNYWNKAMATLKSVYFANI